MKNQGEKTEMRKDNDRLGLFREYGIDWKNQGKVSNHQSRGAKYSVILPPQRFARRLQSWRRHRQHQHLGHIPVYSLGAVLQHSVVALTQLPASNRKRSMFGSFVGYLVNYGI